MSLITENLIKISAGIQTCELDGMVRNLIT